MRKSERINYSIYNIIWAFNIQVKWQHNTFQAIIVISLLKLQQTKKLSLWVIYLQHKVSILKKLRTIA